MFRIPAKLKRAVAIVSLAGLGAWALPWTSGFVAGLANTVIVSGFTVGGLLGALGLISAYMFVRREI